MAVVVLITSTVRNRWLADHGRVQIRFAHDVRQSLSTTAQVAVLPTKISIHKRKVMHVTSSNTESRGQVACHSCFVFGRSRIQISVRRPAILTEVFVVFLSPLKKMMGE
jgi:hypothetical protein